MRELRVRGTRARLHLWRFLATGATKWNDPKQFPWTMGWLPSYQSEGRIYAKYLMKEMPNAKIAIATIAAVGLRVLAT